MNSAQLHTVSLVRCLIILSGLLFFSFLPVEAEKMEYSVSQLVEVGKHIDSESGSEEGASSNEPVPSSSMFDLVLKETPEQEQITAASYSLSLANQGNNPPEPDCRKLMPYQASHLTGYLLIKETPGSNRSVTASPHGFSFLLSLPGDIAINAP